MVVSRPVIASSRQRGVALITALLIVALAVTAVAAIASRHQLDIRRTSNLFEGDQSNAYALGVETWSRVLLRRDAKDSDTDHLKENWAARIPPLPVPGGEVGGYIEDLQGRFNINNLVLSLSTRENTGESDAKKDAGPEGEVEDDDNRTADNEQQDETPEGKTQGGASSINAQSLEVFRRLLLNLDIPADLAEAVMDWMDEDIEARFPAGAEDDYYLGRTVPYRTANRPIQSISELRLVKGMTAKDYEILAPYITALPTATLINVNTAPEPVLMALGEGITEADAKTLAEDRGEEGYATVGDFMKNPVLAESKVNPALLTVESDYFMVHAETRVGDGRARMLSTLYREDKDKIETLVRVRGIE